MLVSKFEKLYLFRKVLMPIICIGLALLLLDVKIYYKKDADVTYPILFLLAVACISLLYNLNSIYKLVVEEKKSQKFTFYLEK